MVSQLSKHVRYSYSIDSRVKPQQVKPQSYCTLHMLHLKEPCKDIYALWCDVGDNGENECVSQQEVAVVKAELAAEVAAVKADMQGRVDTLQSQLNYWQNVTINILKELYFSPNSGRMYTLTQRSATHIGYYGHSFKR